MFDSMGPDILVPYLGFQWRYPFENLIPLVGGAKVIHVLGVVGNIKGVVGIIKGAVGIIKGVFGIKRVVVIERVATFPDTRL